MTMSVPGSNGMMEKWSGGVLECWGGIEKSVFKSREDHTSTISHRPYLENIRYDAFQYSITPLLRFNERTITGRAIVFDNRRRMWYYVGMSTNFCGNLG